MPLRIFAYGDILCSDGGYAGYQHCISRGQKYPMPPSAASGCYRDTLGGRLFRDSSVDAGWVVKRRTR